MFNNVGITFFNSLPVLYFNRPEEFNDALQADHYSYRLNESFSPQEFSENLKRNKKPMLVLVGSKDEAFHSEAFEPIFAQYAPHADVEIIDGVKHLNLPRNEITINLVSTWLSTTYRAALQRPIR